MKKNIIDYILIILFIIGFLIFIYPIASNYITKVTQVKDIDNYLDLLSKLEPSEYQKYIEEAQEYNSRIAKGQDYESISIDGKGYNEILKVGNSTLLGYMEIDSIKMKIPIYHGTTKEALMAGAGHWERSSFPIESESSHAIFFGHRGMPSAKLFTELDSVVEGETIRIHVLDEEYYYKVEKIYTIKPEELEEYLKIQKGREIITLITCTPYGVNTHRLLIRGVRIDPDELNTAVSGNARKLQPLGVVRMIVLPIILISLLAAIITRRKKAKQ